MRSRTAITFPIKISVVNDNFFNKDYRDTCFYREFIEWRRGKKTRMRQLNYFSPVCTPHSLRRPLRCSLIETNCRTDTATLRQLQIIIMFLINEYYCFAPLMSRMVRVWLRPLRCHFDYTLRCEDAESKSRSHIIQSKNFCNIKIRSHLNYNNLYFYSVFSWRWHRGIILEISLQQATVRCVKFTKVAQMD